MAMYQLTAVLNGGMRMPMALSRRKKALVTLAHSLLHVRPNQYVECNDISEWRGTRYAHGTSHKFVKNPNLNNYQIRDIDNPMSTIQIIF